MPKKLAAKRAGKPAKSAAKKAKKKAKASAPHAALEAAVREFAKLLGGNETIPQSELDAMLTSLAAPSPIDGLSDAEADVKYRAQEFAFEAMEAETAAKARKFAKRALALDPDCVDALLVLTDLDARTPRETIEGLQEAVAAGERSLGARFIRENQGDFWLLIETRPWMRAMELLANSLGNEGISVDAIRIYERMLDLNPNDNQGVRDPLLGLYLETGDLNGAGRLLKKYKNDASANFAWARVLERFLAGTREEAAVALKEARHANRHLELYLTGNKLLPKDLPEMYSPGSQEEAALCMNNLSGAWAAHKDAVFWMLDQFAAEGLLPKAGKGISNAAPSASNTVQ